MAHRHGSGHDALGWVLADGAIVLLLAAAIGYAVALRASRSRSPWPVRRTLSWYAGLGCASAALLGPVAGAAHASFTAHMAGHLLLGMAAPLLLALAAPVTLGLRALPVAAARSLTRLLRSRYLRGVTHPVAAAVLNAGGLWLLYTTPLYQSMHGSALLHALVHTHVLVAGYLFTAALVGPDPDPHRASMPVRSAVLIGFIAAHSMLAKWLYAHPPAGVGRADGEAGALLMYYGGDAVDVVLIVLLFSGWYAATRPRAAARAGMATGS
ncbi:MAG: cytochrome c oxidase assembly protein [Micrococcus sp.]|nr:cytochrome c oxidase assembly protein [Micrococcus sp.]